MVTSPLQGIPVGKIAACLIVALLLSAVFVRLTSTPQVAGVSTETLE